MVALITKKRCRETYEEDANQHLPHVRRRSAGQLLRPTVHNAPIGLDAYERLPLRIVRHFDLGQVDPDGRDGDRTVATALALGRIGLPAMIDATPSSGRISQS
jgi:hypothetical protein